MKTNATLWYFADPMCSWCWGFSPVLDEIKKSYGANLNIALILGGLRPGTREPITQESREEILHHWHAVQKTTGQVFDFDDSLAEGFVYDTEPACRAVIAMSGIEPEYTLPYFKTVQEAFYRDKKDVTDGFVLAELACMFGVDKDIFMQFFNKENVREKTQLHFQHTRQAGVRGFPTIIIQAEKSFNMLANGYRPYEEVSKEIDDFLEED